MAKPESPNINNILRLLKKRVDEFSGESKRSYQKAFTSFQYYLISNFTPNEILSQGDIENWVVDNRLRGLSEKTTSFYLDKVASLYSNVASGLEGGKSLIFKNVKRKLKDSSFDRNYSLIIDLRVKKITTYGKEQFLKDQKELFDSINLTELPYLGDAPSDKKLDWACMALKCGFPASVVLAITGPLAPNLDILALCEQQKLSSEYISEIFKSVAETASGKRNQWFAMRLRPYVTFERLLERFQKISGLARIPELFYPCREIAHKVGRKIVWKGQPLIRDIVFFKYNITDIYPLFQYLYDIAWCYRNPGNGAEKFAAIPDKAMEDFREALGLIGPEFEISPAGEMNLNPGDEVVIIAGDFASNKARILKSSAKSGNTVYRVMLLDSFGHWEIGIDARLLKKI